ncbi:MAG: hypothetical protein ACKVRN_10240 [Pyrinomonadaceae bacterium]
MEIAHGSKKDDSPKSLKINQIILYGAPIVLIILAGAIKFFEFGSNTWIIAYGLIFVMSLVIFLALSKGVENR